MTYSCRYSIRSLQCPARLVFPDIDRQLKNNLLFLMLVNRKEEISFCDEVLKLTFIDLSFCKIVKFRKKNLRQLFLKRRAASVHSTFKLVFFSLNHKTIPFTWEAWKSPCYLPTPPSIKYHFYFYLSFIRCFLLGQFYFCSTFITFNKNGFAGNAEPTNETHFVWESNFVWSNFDRHTNHVKLTKYFL